MQHYSKKQLKEGLLISIFLNRSFLIMAVLVMVGLLLVSQWGWLQAAESSKGPVYKIGVVPQFGQRKLFRIWVPIIKRLKKDTGLNFELVGSHQIPDFEDKFMAGNFDFAYMNPYHAVNANRTQGYIPLVRDGSRVLQGIIVVRKDNPIHSVKELNSQSVAYPSAKALGASLLPRSELVKKFNVTTTPVYAKTHTSVYLHVVQNLVVAGGGIKSTLEKQKPQIKNLLRVLYYTQTHKSHPIVAHPRVPIGDMLKVQYAFLKMSKTLSGAALLKKIPMNKAIIATMPDYDSVKNLNFKRLRTK
ncbi:Phosphonate ABC transporter phosphate-binding periplasmic component (TC 3.A.1.9.1) [hydrothermal vent metagenome]|uniref:Phosphonate ABC transporter phosphate-binding periplasmic component (TC 3.A.1.9.1) n=1 Tax=hydrothermal vent metagenome TaxID=652676 RepID=A0A3B0Z2F8_9ZZZZ